MARRYPGGSREDRPRGGAARTVARLRHVWSRGEGEARLDADPSRSASSRATAAEVLASSASARVARVAGTGARRDASGAEPSEEARTARGHVPVPAPGSRGRGRGRARREGQGGFLDRILLPSERGLRSPLELRRHGVALQRDAPQRGLAPVRPRLLHTVQRLFRGQGRPRSGAVGGRGRLRRGNRGIRDRLLRTSYRRGYVSQVRLRERLLRTSYRRRYVSQADDSANVSSDASNEPSSSSPDAREVTRTALDAAGERTGFGFASPPPPPPPPPPGQPSSSSPPPRASRARRLPPPPLRARARRSRPRLPTLPPRSERRRASLDAASRFRRRRQRATTRARPSSASRRAQRVAPPPGTPKPRAPPRRARRKTAPPLPARRPKAPRFLRARKTTPPSQEPAWGDPRAPEVAEPRPCLPTPRCRKSAALPPAAAETSQPPRPRTRPPSLPLFSKMRAAPPPRTPRPGSRTASGAPRRRARLAKAPGVFRRVPVLRPRPTRRPRHPPPPRE